MHLIVVGGSDAGISAGLRARELSPATEVTVVLADAFLNYSVCGLPFYVSGETPGWRQLAHRELAELEAAGLNLLLNHRAVAIDTRHGVEVRPGVAAAAIERDGDARLTVHDSRGQGVRADLVLIAAGVKPNAELAVSAGAERGAHAAIRVDRRMATSVPDVWAAGDCVETWHRLLKTPTYLPLGTTAHKQGRVAGETSEAIA